MGKTTKGTKGAKGTKSAPYTSERFLSHRIPKGLTPQEQAAWIKRHSRHEPQEQH